MHESRTVGEATESIAKNRGPLTGLDDTKVDLAVIKALVVLLIGWRGSHENSPRDAACGGISVQVRGRPVNFIGRRAGPIDVSSNDRLPSDIKAPATLRHVKIGTRGLAKNRAQIFTLFALSNLFLMRVRLTA